MNNVVLKRIFERSTNDERLCSICYNDIETFDDVFIMSNCCGNMFHNTCITKNIIYENYNCPMCNLDINNKQTILDKFATPTFLYKNFKDKLANVSGKTFDELDVLFHNNNLNEIIKIQFTSNEHSSLIDEQDINKLLCSCCTCDNILILQLLKKSIIDDNISLLKNFLYKINLDFNTFSYDTKLNIVTYCFEIDSLVIIQELIKNNWIDDLIIEEIPEIYNIFINNMEIFDFTTSFFIFKYFKLCIPKTFLDQTEIDYISDNKDSHEIFDIIKKNSKIIIDIDNYIEYQN